MKFILKGTKTLKENINDELKETRTLDMKPETFLELTMPQADWVKVKSFIGLYSSQFPEHNTQAEEIYKSAEVGEIGDEVITRAFNNFKKGGGYRPELATSDGPTPCSLAVKAFPVPYVTSHSGRARACMAAMGGIKKITCSVSFYGKTAVEVMQDTSSKYLNGQKFGKDPINSVDKKKVFGNIK